MKRLIQSRAGLLSAVAVSALMVASVTPTLAGNPNPGILPVQSHASGKSYAEWSAQWWRWTLAFPATADPASDTAPQESAQSGPVWFLAGLHTAAPKPAPFPL